MAKVLVAEDDDYLRRALVRVLDLREAMIGIGASSLIEASDLLGAQQFDAVIADLNLGDGSGLDLLREGRGFVLMTGETLDSSDLTRLAALGVRVLLKPFSAKEYLEVIGAAVKDGRRPVNPSSTSVQDGR